MTDILQKTFSNAFSWNSAYWFRSWDGVEQAHPQPEPVMTQFIGVNPLRPSGDIRCQKSLSPLVQVMVCCLIAPSYQCSQKTFMVHQTFVWWALYILFKFVKFLIGHLGLAIGNVRHVRWFSLTLSYYRNQCWLIISKIQWHSYDGNFTRDTSAINH